MLKCQQDYLAWKQATQWGRRPKTAGVKQEKYRRAKRAETTAQLASLAHFFSRTLISPFSLTEEPGPWLQEYVLVSQLVGTPLKQVKPKKRRA